MPEKEPSVLRLLQISDLHIDSDNSEILKDRYRRALSTLGQTFKSEDERRIAAISDAELCSWFCSFCLNSTRRPPLPNYRKTLPPEVLATAVAAIRSNLDVLIHAMMRDTDATIVTSALNSFVTNNNIQSILEENSRELLKAIGASGVMMLRQSLLRLSGARSPFDAVLITGDLVQKGFAGDQASYLRKLDLAFNFIECILETARVGDRSSVMIIAGNHDWRYELPKEPAAESAEAIEYKPHLMHVIRRLNAFYEDSLPHTQESDLYFHRLLRFDNTPVGFLPQPAHLAILALQAEPVPYPFSVQIPLPADIDSQVEKHAVAEDRALSRDEALLVEAEETRLDAFLRRVLPPSSAEEITLISCSHRQIGLGTLAESAKRGVHRRNYQARLNMWAGHWRIALHIAGHDHAGRMLGRIQAGFAEAAGNEVPGQLIAQPAINAFNVLELVNRFPGSPLLRPPAQYRFHQNGVDENEPGATDPWTCSLSHDLGDGLRLLRCSWRDGFHSSISLFHSTMLKNQSFHTRSRRSYVNLFRETSHEHACPYPDVYTRYYRWIFETAEATEDGPSDALFVVHLGPFTQWLLEPMNRDYFLDQVRAVKEGKIAVYRLWLVPNGRYRPADYGFNGENLPWTDLTFLRAMEAMELPVDAEDPITTLLQPGEEDNNGNLVLDGYQSFVLTEGVLALLATPNLDLETNRRRFHAISPALAQRNLSPRFKRTLRNLQDGTAWKIREACNTILTAMANREDNWKLWIGRAYRQRNGRIENMTFSFADESMQTGLVALGDTALTSTNGEVHLAFTRLASYLMGYDSFELDEALRDLLRVQDQGRFKHFVDSACGHIEGVNERAR